MPPIPPTLSKFASEQDALLDSIDKLRAEMEERFHMYEEIRSLPAADRDALFDILWRAQSGDTAALDAISKLVYDEVPVPMEEFILGKQYLGLAGLINVAKLDIICRFDRPEVRKAFIAAGSGGGKSFLVSIAKARQVYRLMCLKRPDLFYMLGPLSRIAVINLSISKDQARDVIFDEFKARVLNSPWFRKRINPDELKMTKATFPKRVHVFSGGSQATSYYGYHTIFGSVDEISWMPEKTGENVGAQLVEALTKSLHTRFPRAYKLFVISSLRADDDWLYRKVEEIRERGIQLV